MTDDREMELVSADLDGKLDADDRAALEQLLESSAEAREVQSELQELDSLLKGVPELDPPASLQAQILARINPTPVRSKPSISGWLASLIPGAGLRYALAASTGALVAAVFINSDSPPPDAGDITDFVGTMAPNVGTTDAKIIDSLAVVDDGFESQVRLERNDGFLLLRVQVDTGAPLDIAVDLSKAGVEADAVAQLDSDFESIAIAGQAVQMRAVGRQTMSILLRRVDDSTPAGEAKITLEFSSNGQPRQSGILEANW